MNEQIIGVDLGGTRLRAAVLNRDLTILERRETLTLAHEGVEATTARMTAFVGETISGCGDEPIAGIGISCPGPVNPVAGLLVAPPNLLGWHNVPLVQMFQKQFGHTTYIGNDANVAALAESARGAAQGFRNVIFITISTGIGGGIIHDGRLVLGRDGLAAEVGHINMIVNGTVTTLEKEAAGPALARKARARIEAGESSLMRELVDGDLDKLSAKIVGKAADQGDALAIEVVKRGAFIVGMGLASLLHLFNPEIIVIGGGVSNIGALLFDTMREAMEKHVIDRAYTHDLIVKPAALGENVSVIGAAALVLTRGGVEDVANAARKMGGG
ncbi:MAG: ROK family protein [Chloroflexota bacterium]|nr:ROK family protein [Chloroflexota bacterium]